MTTNLRGKTDDALHRFRQALAPYEASHRQARVDLFRQNTASIHVRIIDPDFAAVDRVDRHAQIWQYLEPLSEDVQSQLTVLLLLTPIETTRSIANQAFENATR